MGLYFFPTSRNLEITNFVVPNRDQVTMTSPFMDAYSKRVIQRCHKKEYSSHWWNGAQIN
jgi:malate synthase